NCAVGFLLCDVRGRPNSVDLPSADTKVQHRRSRQAQVSAESAMGVQVAADHAGYPEESRPRVGLFGPLLRRRGAEDRGASYSKSAERAFAWETRTNRSVPRAARGAALTGRVRCQTVLPERSPASPAPVKNRAGRDNSARLAQPVWACAAGAAVIGVRGTSGGCS